MDKKEIYLRKQISTMVGTNHVSSMKLTTLIALLNGYNKESNKEIIKDIKDIRNNIKNLSIKQSNVMCTNDFEVIETGFILSNSLLNKIYVNLQSIINKLK